MAVQLPRRQDSFTNFSVTSKQSTIRATAQEVHDLVYGHDVHAQPPADVEAALQRIYEPNASMSPYSSHRSRPPISSHPAPPAVYENPLLTATSRAVITDIYRAAHQLSELDMPKPLAMFATLFRRTPAPREPWFRALRVWSEIGDICETESFDGHRKSIIEHTLHVLLLPGLHAGRTGAAQAHSPSDPALDVSLYSLAHLQRTSQPALAVPGTRVTLPSPLHLQLHVLSRIEFNDLGRVTHHRDLWDVKDLVALVPGAALAQFVGTRVMARALAAAGNLGAWIFGVKHAEERERDDIEWSGAADNNSLGLLGIDLPDVDRDTIP